MLSFLEFIFSTSEIGTRCGVSLQELSVVQSQSPLLKGTAHRLPSRGAHRGTPHVLTEVPCAGTAALDPAFTLPVTRTPSSRSPRSLLHQLQVGPAPPAASPRARSGPARPTRARIRNYNWKGLQHGSPQPSPASQCRHRVQQGLSTQGLALRPLTMLEAEPVQLWTLAAWSHQLSPERATLV